MFKNKLSEIVVLKSGANVSVRNCEHQRTDRNPNRLTFFLQYIFFIVFIYNVTNKEIFTHRQNQSLIADYASVFTEQKREKYLKQIDRGSCYCSQSLKIILN